jgi:hypothetical protein
MMFTVSMLDGFIITEAVSWKDYTFIPLIQVLVYNALVCTGSQTSVEMHISAEACVRTS